MTRRCEARHLLAGPCGQEAAGRFASACVHEHVKAGWLCAAHAAMPGTAVCRSCLEGPQPHQCPVQITELTAAGSDTRERNGNE